MNASCIGCSGLLLVGLCVTASAVRPVRGRIQPYPQNPRYWQFKGKPVLLLGGTVIVNLTALQGMASYKWFNPQTGKTVAGGSVNSGDNSTFRAPFSGDSVLHIRLITPQDETH